MKRFISTVLAFATSLSVCASATWADEATDYLNSIKASTTPYIAPDDIDPRFTTVLYVNVATSGPHRQRMWILHRDELGGPWHLGLWDKRHWKRKARKGAVTPSYSWPISSGRHYRGDRKSGPTPPGVYGLDERRWRYGRGWLQAGMRHVMHIDYHYRCGRVSGVAFHGTNYSRYRRLGRADSHGCVRMRQELALAMMDRITGRDGVLSEQLRWGQVPRYWRHEKGRRRMGYARDGKNLLAGENGVAGAKAIVWPVVHDTAAPLPRPLKPQVLTKTGFRALVVIFKN